MISRPKCPLLYGDDLLTYAARVRRRLLLLLGLVVLLAAAVTGWASWRALQARTELTSAQALLTAVQKDLRDGRVDEARAALPAVQARLDRAAAKVHGPAWTVALRVPVAGGNLHAVRRAADAGRLLGDEALPPLVHALDTVQTEHPLRDGRVDLAVLRRVGADVEQAARASGRARAMLQPHDALLLPAVSDKLTATRERLGSLDDSLQTAARAFTVAPAMLGADGPREYFVAVQNNAEARATGGLIGAFALVRTDRGRITLERTGTNVALEQSDTPVAFPVGAAGTWQDIGSTRAWFDTTLTPHFPDAARSMSGLWQRQSGQLVDGVLSVDPVVMSELLRGAPPIRLRNGSTVGAGNVVDFVGHREYVDFPDNEVRKPLLSQLAAEVFHQVVAAKDAVGTAKAVLRASSSGHLFVWSRRPQEQAVIAGGLVGGALPATDVPYLSVLTQNYGGNKLDFYLRRQVTVRRQADGQLRVTVVLRNTAPLGLPLYMTVRADKPVEPVPYGQAKVGLAVYGAKSSVISRAEVDGRPVLLEPDRDHGSAFGTTTVEVPRGRPVTITLSITEPKGRLVYRQQPLVVADALDLAVPHRVVGR